MKTRNPIFRKCRGRLGDFIARSGKDGSTILSFQPRSGKRRKFSPAQRTHQERFADAAAYGKGVMRDPSLKEAYQPVARRKRISVYNAAIRDYFHEPEIRDVDTSRYAGNAGEEMVIRAVDDVEVLRVHVFIRKNGEVLEEGDAVRERYNRTLWHYEAQRGLDIEGCIIEVQAEDRPGNVTVREFAL